MKKAPHHNAHKTGKPKSTIKQRLTEVRGIVCLIGAVFLLLSLLTYTASHTEFSSYVHLKNWGGRIGNQFSEILFKFFGTMAYAFPALFTYTGICLLSLRKSPSISPRFLLHIVQIAGFIAILAAGCGLYSVECHNKPPFHCKGGRLGHHIAALLMPLLNIGGTQLLLTTLLLSGGTLLTGVSWKTIIKWVIKIILGCFVYSIRSLLKLIQIKPSATSKTQHFPNKRPLLKPEFYSKFDSNNKEIGLKTPFRKNSKALFAPTLSPDLYLIPPHSRQSDSDLPPSKSHTLLDFNTETLYELSKTPASSETSITKKKPNEKSEKSTIPLPEIPKQNLSNAAHEGVISPVSATQAPELKLNLYEKSMAHENEPLHAPHRRSSLTTSSEARPSFTKALLPSLSLLDPPTSSATKAAYSPEELTQLSREVELRLKDFGIEVQVVSVHPGPVITRFEMQLAPGIKVSRITTLSKDLARSLSVISVRIVEIIPGKSVVGLELPNRHREIVRLQEILSSAVYQKTAAPLPLALGKDISGHPVVVNLSKMPHLLTAGTTGSGKSVGLNAMLLSILYKATPEQVRFILIDPKMLELAIYEGIPHLLAPVVTDMKEAANALRWCVAEMERRYKLMATLGVRNLLGYNQKVQEALDKGRPLKNPFIQPDEENTSSETLHPLPYIVVLIDEFADMIMVVGKKVEELIARIAQKARAAGIHLILATQRPSVDVITGLIKANIPTRIAFQVSSRIDSRTILDQQGAEQLLGHGDMLYLVPGTGIPTRVHGAFVEDHEVHRVVNALKQTAPPDYQLKITEDLYSDNGELSEKSRDNTSGEDDPLYDQAVQIVLETRRASISGVQRRLKIGYNRAARLIESMEQAGLVSAMESNGNREVLVPEETR